jgi:hypothetical protein
MIGHLDRVSEWGFRPISGTARFSNHHMSMNDRSNSQRCSPKKNGAQSKLPKKTAAGQFSDFSPARQLMICMGWLRLFQVIIEPCRRRA